MILLVLGAVGFGYLRDSSLVAVRDVQVTGAHGRSASAVRAALVRTGRDMTTLHVREDDLRRAVAAFPIVKDVRASARLPRGLHVRVVQHDPVAVVARGGRRVPVAADGTLLVDEPATAGLPEVPGGDGVNDGRLTGVAALAAVKLMGAAPRPLRPLVTAVRRDGAGLHVFLSGGPQLDFGAPVRLAAKWTAAASVLADPRSAGAVYIDLRVPQRPVAGPFAPQPTGEPLPSVDGASDPTVAAEPVVGAATPATP